MLDDMFSYFKKLFFMDIFNKENKGNNYQLEEVNRELVRGLRHIFIINKEYQIGQYTYTLFNNPYSNILLYIL